MKIEKFNEFIKESYEIIPIRKWQSELRYEDKLPWSDKDISIIKKLKKAIEDSELKIEIGEGNIKIETKKLESMIEPYVNITKHNGFYVKERGDMVCMYGDSYEGRQREIKLYRTDKLEEVIQPELF